MRHARDALACYAQVAPAHRSPTRQAISRLDLGLVLVAKEDLYDRFLSLTDKEAGGISSPGSKASYQAIRQLVTVRFSDLDDLDVRTT